MNRVEELTIRLADHGLDLDEQRELGSLLVDESSREQYCRLLELEACLLSLAQPSSVAANTIAQIQRDASANLEQSVMRAILKKSDQESQQVLPDQRARRTWYALFGVTAIAACIVLMALFSDWFSTDENVQPSSRTIASSAILIDQSPDVRLILSDGASAMPETGKPIPPGATLSTLADGWAVLQFPDGSRLDLYSQSQLKLNTTPSGEQQIGLVRGSVRADVKPQPNDGSLVIRTPHARVRVRSTQITLSSMKDLGTRLDLDRGTAQLEQDDQTPMPLSAGSTAFVAVDTQPVLVTKRSTVLRRPERAITFRGLRRLSAVLTDGTAVASSNWQAVFWKPDVPITVLPVSQYGRKGVRISQTTGPMMAYREDRGNQLCLWDARLRKTVRKLAIIGEEQFGAVSPTGDWMAMIDSRRGDGRKSFRLIDPSGRRKPIRFSGKQIISAMAASPDGKLLAVGRRRIGQSKGNAVDVIDCVSGKAIGRLDVQFSHPIVLAFSADGRRLAVGLSGRLQVWDVALQKRICQIEHLGSPILRVALNHDGSAVAGTSQGDRVWLWEADTSEERCVILPNEQTRGIAFSANDVLFLLTKDGRISSWNVRRPINRGTQQAAL